MQWHVCTFMYELLVHSLRDAVPTKQLCVPQSAWCACVLQILVCRSANTLIAGCMYACPPVDTASKRQFLRQLSCTFHYVIF